jgi:hypothetical protein
MGFEWSSLRAFVDLLTLALTAAATMTGGSARSGAAVRTPIAEKTQCHLSNLALAYSGGQPSTGFFFAQISVWDVGKIDCALVGAVHIVGLYEGLPDTNSLAFSVEPNLILTPRDPSVPLTATPRAGEVAAAIPIDAEYRDDPTGSPDGLCVTHRVVPAEWLVSIDGFDRTVVDWHQPGQGGGVGFLTCNGKIGETKPAVQRETISGWGELSRR